MIDCNRRGVAGATVPAKDGRVNMSVAVGRKLQEYSRTAEQTARDELVVNHLWLVRHIMGKIAARLPSGVDVENLESAGVLGLVEAAGRFDATRGVDFRSFATLRIRGAIFDEARRNCPLPQVVMRRVALVAKAQENLSGPLSIEALATMTGLSQDDVLDALIAMPLIQVRSLEHTDGDPTGQMEGSPQAAAEGDERKQLLADAIASLPERERLVVTLYYMEDLRLKEIGQLLSLSESRVSRLLAAAQHQLREYVCSH
jgi:RNA polymerase sigma factor FliA